MFAFEGGEKGKGEGQCGVRKGGCQVGERARGVVTYMG